MIRIRVDNFGLWIMYCYIEFYVFDGMVMFFNEFFFYFLKIFKYFLICGDFKIEDEEKFFVIVDVKNYGKYF